MRIAHICQSYPPMISGAALAVQQLATGMAAKGHEVLVLAASDGRRAYDEEDRNLQIVRLRSWRNPLRASQRFLLWPQQAIYRHLEAFRPDVIHLHEPLILGLSGLWAARALGVPATVTLHQLPWFIAPYLPSWPGIQPAAESTLWAYGRWFLRQCTAVIVSTDTIAEIVRARGIQHPHVIGLGIDLDRFTPQTPDPNEERQLRQKYGLDPTLPVVLHVGRIDVEKRVEHVVRAMARVLQQEEAQLLVVGDGRQLDAVTELSKRAAIDNRCHFPGSVPIEGDLPGLYRLASVFVTASPIETFGYVVLEAMASARPIVAVRAACLPELVDNGANGYLAPPNDEEALAPRLVRLLRNPEQAREMGEQGLATAAPFRVSATLTGHERLYRSLERAPAKAAPDSWAAI